MNENYVNNPGLARAVEEHPTFRNVAMEIAHDRERQAIKYPYVYHVSGEVTGQQTTPFNLNIEGGTDFKSIFMTGSAFSYEDTSGGGDATSFPVPNSLGLADWSGRGLSVQITDNGSSRVLTSGYVPWELLFTPGYGLNFQGPMPFRYFFERSSQIKFDVRNRDNANRSHSFDIALVGYKVLTPNRT